MRLRESDRRTTPLRRAGRCLGYWAASSVITLALPPAIAAQTVATCPEDMDPELSGLAGVVRDSTDGVVIPGARIRADWDDEGLRRSLSVETDESGVYYLCGLPTMRPLEIRAAFASFGTEPISVNIEPGPPAGWDFRVPVETGILPGVSITPGRIVGQVLDRQSGRPVEAASVVLTGGDQQRLSNGSGRFVFDGVPPGIYRVGVEHLAFETADQLISVPADRTLEVTFELTVDPIELEPLVVTAVRPKHLEVRGFYDRKEVAERIGNGVFIMGEEIRRTGALRVTHYLGRLNGIRVDCSGWGNNNCTIRMTGGARA